MTCTLNSLVSHPIKLNTNVYAPLFNFPSKTIPSIHLAFRQEQNP